MQEKQNKQIRLLTLLRAYDLDKNNAGWEFDLGYLSYNWRSKEYSELLLVSKKYGFVDWLVKNHKVSLGKTDCYQFKELGYSDSESLLMLLANHDEPVKLLSDIIKR